MIFREFLPARINGGSALLSNGSPASALINSEFFGASVPASVTLTGTAGFESANAFGTGTVSTGAGGQTITQTAGFNDADAFGAGTLRLRLGGAGFSDADSFGTGGVSTRLAGTGFSDADAFGAGSLALRLAGLGFSDSDAFGAGAVSVLPPAQTVTQTAGFADADAFGSPAIRLWLQQIAGIEQANDFGGGALTIIGGLVRGPLRGSALRASAAESRPGDQIAGRQMDAPSARTSTNTPRPADASRVREKA